MTIKPKLTNEYSQVRERARCSIKICSVPFCVEMQRRVEKVGEYKIVSIVFRKIRT